MLPVTLIFVLSASLIVALIYLPVMGGVTGRMSRMFARSSDWLERRFPWIVRAALVPVSLMVIFVGAMQVLNPAYLFATPLQGALAVLPGAAIFLAGAFMASVTLGAVEFHWQRKRIRAGRRRTLFGWFIKLIAGNPIMPIVTAAAVLGFVMSVFGYFGENNRGVEFFVESEPEQAIVYVLARGNLSLEEKDAIVRQAEDIVLAHPGVDNAFAFAGDGGLNSNTGGAEPPKETIGQVQLETIPWEDRTDRPDLDGDIILEELQAELEQIPGVRIEILAQARGPASAKPVHLRLKGDNWEDLIAATETARARFEATPGLHLVEDTLPLPGIDWQIDVDVEKAGRFGADVATVGAMVQLVTRGILLDTMRVDSSDEEIDIRVRLPEADRVLSTLDTLKVRTADGLVPLSNFVTRQPVAKLAEIARVDQKRYFDVKAAVRPGLTTFVTGDGESARILAHGRAVPEGETGDLTVGATDYLIEGYGDGQTLETLKTADLRAVPLTANERIAQLTDWLGTAPLGLASRPNGPAIRRIRRKASNS